MSIFAITDEERLNAFEGFFVYDCVVRDVKTFSFLLLQNIEDSASGDRRLLSYFPCDEEGERLSWTDYEGFRRPRLGVSEIPKNQACFLVAPMQLRYWEGAMMGWRMRSLRKPFFPVLTGQKSRVICMWSAPGGRREAIWPK